MKPKNIEITIEELVLHGFSPSDGYSIKEAVERELRSMFRREDVVQSLSQGREISHIDGGEAARGSKPEAIGAKVARAVYGGLSR